ncbi:MAG: helical backbone metal receptor [Burkholderiaceae bacterium]
MLLLAAAPVVLAQPATAPRIISLAPALTELLFSVGAGGQVVGTTSFSDHPGAARAIEVIGSYSGIDQERIVALQPDWVIAWSGGTPPTWTARLRQLGLHVHESEFTRLSDIAVALRELGVLSGHERQGAGRPTPSNDAWPGSRNVMRDRHRWTCSTRSGPIR